MLINQFFDAEGIDIGRQDPHHWLPHYFARHALQWSGFERA
jgi:hypothetical protein